MVVASASGGRALIVDIGRREIGLFPVHGGHVLDHEACSVPPDALEPALAALAWPQSPGPGRSDWPWLAAWLRRPRNREAWLVVSSAEDRSALVARVRRVLAARDDKVGALRGRT